MSAQAVDLRLRVAWGSGAARQWQGALTVQYGSFSQLTHLGLDADEAATIYLNHDKVHIEQPTGREYDGFDIQVVGSTQTILKLELAPLANPQERKQIDIPLEELINGHEHAELDSQGNQILIQRVSGDKLRTKFTRPSLVFSPNENFQFEVHPHLTGLDDLTNLRQHIQLFRVGDDTPLWDQTNELPPGPNNDLQPLGAVNVPLPESEGVYEVVISVLRKRFVNTFVRSKPLLQRQIQVVVVAAEPPTPSDGNWNLLETIDPGHASWMEWLSKVPRLPLLPDFRQEPLGHGKSTIRQHLGQELVELAPSGWQAYPTPTGEIGKPHILEVEYPSNLVQTLGISIMEPNAVGKVVPLGLDSGVDVSEEASASAPKMLRHRLIFWPRTSAPLVLLTNRSESQPAVFGKIRIYNGPDTLPCPQHINGPMLNAPRLLAAYFDRPLFPENFTAPEAADDWSGRSLKDWVTFYEGGKRLVEYLKHVGYNGAIISVASQGGTIYPSKILTPIPKYDTGTFFRSGQDPIQKDVLELLYRLFDREGLTLVAAVEFSSTLEELEKPLRHNPEMAEGIALVDRQGKTWREGYGTKQGMAPHYNPLDSRVQAAMRRVLNEISDRYKHHRSFGGLSLQLGPDTYALLPGEQWGYDRVTRKRFERDTKQGPNASKKTPETIRALDAQREWLKWRAGVLAQFYRSILADVQTRRGDARLYLVGGELFTNSNLQSMLKPTIPNRLRVDQVLLQLGLATEHFAGQDQIVFFRPERSAPRSPLAKQAVNINLATNSAADTVFGQIEPAASLFCHERLTLSLPSFDAQSPFGKENTHTVLFSHVAPSAESNRQRFVHHLALRDVQCFADGGWMVPLGQEDSLRDLFQTLAQLPAKKFETVTPQATTLPTQPLVVRTLAHAGKTYVYVVNDSPWTVTADIDIDSAQPCTVTRFGGQQHHQPKWLDGQLTWALDLRPFDVVAAVLSHDAAKVATWRVSVDRATLAQLRRQVDKLNNRAVKLGNPDHIDVLANSGFEEATDRTPGWTQSQGDGVVIGVDNVSRFAGNQSLKLVSRGPIAWVRSDPFEPPKTGRIAVLVRLRTDMPDNQPPLRLAVDGTFLDGKPYYKKRNVGQKSGFPIGEDWSAKPFLYMISDLPSDQLANIRVGFDLMGAGNVWIDDVQVYDSWFQKHEQDDLMIMRGLAARSLSMGRIADCREILNGYWPQFLLQHVAEGIPQVAALPADVPARSGGVFPPPQAKQDTSEPSVFDKVKRLPTKVFPFRLR